MAKTSFYDVESIRKDFPIFKNNSNKKAELFAVSCEIVESSK